MEGQRMKKKQFDRDFKISAVKMITQGGHRVSEVARSLGIHPNIEGDKRIASILFEYFKNIKELNK